jgi:hypothetical protein
MNHLTLAASRYSSSADPRLGVADVASVLSRVRPLVNWQHEPRLRPRSAGLARARRDSLAGATPWLQGDLEADFKRIASMIADLSLRASALSEDTLLNIARFELRTLAGTVSEAADCLDAVFGRSAFGYRDLADILSAQTYKHQVGSLLIWSHLRRHDRGLRQGMEEINAVAGQVKVMTHALNTLALLAEKIPAYKSLLSPGRLGSALQDPVVGERYAEELAELREKHLDEINEVLALRTSVEARFASGCAHGRRRTACPGAWTVSPLGDGRLACFKAPWIAPYPPHAGSRASRSERKIPVSGDFASPLTDSNRRPPPYHLGPPASGCNRRRRFASS